MTNTAQGRKKVDLTERHTQIMDFGHKSRAVVATGLIFSLSPHSPPPPRNFLSPSSLSPPSNLVLEAFTRPFLSSRFLFISPSSSVAVFFLCRRQSSPRGFQTIITIFFHRQLYPLCLRFVGPVGPNTQTEDWSSCPGALPVFRPNAEPERPVTAGDTSIPATRETHANVVHALPTLKWAKI